MVQLIICLLLLSLIALILVLCKREQVARMRDIRRCEQLQPLPQVPKQPQLSDPRIVAQIRTQRISLPPELRQAVLQGMQKGE